MLDHTAKSIGTFRFFATIGLKDRVIRPVSIDDVVVILQRFVGESPLLNQTVGVVGPERLTLREAAVRVARTMQRRALIVPMPIWALYVIAAIGELTMKVPLISIAQVRLLREGPIPGTLAAEPPEDLAPKTRLDDASIRAGLPERTRYGLRDFRRPRLAHLFRRSRILLETDIDAPPERCMELSLTVDTHLGVPGSREVVVDGVRMGVMRLGDHVTWQSRRFGLPVRMTSKITELNAPHHFVDEIQEGPFKRWHHRHEFFPSNGGTRMRDEVHYSLPLGPIGAVADRVFVGRYMTRLLRDQNGYIRELAEGSSARGGD
jgi:ligand-binding SRPBCC domain-containing protein